MSRANRQNLWYGVSIFTSDMLLNYDLWCFFGDSLGISLWILHFGYLCRAPATNRSADMTVVIDRRGSAEGLSNPIQPSAICQRAHNVCTETLLDGLDWVLPTVTGYDHWPRATTTSDHVRTTSQDRYTKTAISYLSRHLWYTSLLPLDSTQVDLQPHIVSCYIRNLR